VVAPNLIHPVPIVVEQIDKDEIEWDEDAQEPVGAEEYTSEVTLQAQVHWRSIDDPDWTWSGRDDSTKGYVLFLWADLRARSITIAVGDHIRKIGDRDVDLYVESFEDAAHYPDLGGAGFLLAFFADRTPVSHVGDH